MFPTVKALLNTVSQVLKKKIEGCERVLRRPFIRNLCAECAERLLVLQAHEYICRVQINRKLQSLLTKSLLEAIKAPASVICDLQREKP